MGVTGCAHPGQGQTEVQRGWVEGWTRELSHLWREDVGEQVCLRHKLSGVSLHKTPRLSFLLFPLASHSPAWECCLSTSALGRLPRSHGQSQHRMLKSEKYGVPDSAELKSVLEKFSEGSLSSLDKNHGGWVLTIREPEPGGR